ncbi:class C sortase [Enterococcus rivorum]|uniref:Class C sortase n=3 Tax=Enterococcus rivorum TaxID=762845 RepID=A0A1E5L0S1_9ENTE|nr:sortase A [Enterococcus rivorum]OEH83762.1 hypothetical protein BCR26_08025 [Enterococcus rivorum]
MAKKKKMKNKKSVLPKIFMILFFMIGLGIFMYPILSNLYANFYHTRVIDSYRENVDKKSESEKSDLVKDMMEYNKEMATGEGAATTDPFKKEEKKKEKKTKHKVLDALEKKLGEVLGYITIPEIDAKIPIYSGASDFQLQKGVGVLPGTSLPIGGEGNHSVITGHRGLPSSKLFTDLPNLKKGDKFFVDILDETHEYEIDQIKTVVPEDISDLQLVPGKDYITLLTCTPYMINTHRLLVRGVRVPLEDKDKKGKDMDCCCIIPLIILIVINFFILILMWLIYRMKRREEKDRQEKEQKEQAQERRKKRKQKEKAIDS